MNRTELVELDADPGYDESTCRHCGAEIYKWKGSRTGPWTHGTGPHRRTGCIMRDTYATPV